MKRASTIVTLLAALASLAHAELPASAPDVRPPALADVEEALGPGLTLTFAAAGATDSRTSRLVALHVPEGAAPTPFLKPGPFKATWSGNFVSRIRDTVSFTAAGRGVVKVTINDQPVLEASGDDLAAKPGTPVQLKKGKNAFVVEYTSPDKGPAELRLLWQAESFPAEPIPPTMFTHDTSARSLREHARVRAGRETFAELRCARCHVPPEKFPTSAMPELAMDAPALAGVGSRLNEGFVAAWIENPKSLRPQATMPRLFHGPDAATNSKDIAAYLATLGTKSAEAAAPDDAAISAGARLFTTLGCVACHIPPDSDKSDPARIPLSVVRAKWQPAALPAFLKQPEHHYAWIRMPNFRLSDAEASQLASYLLAKSPQKDYPASGDPAKGKTLLTTSGCLNCHTAPDAATGHKSPALADLAKSDWTKGCLARDDAARATAPDFSLTDDQRGALQSFASTGFTSLTRDNPTEVAERQYATANCAACHMRDNLGDTWSDLKEEIAQLESALPPAADHGEHFAPDQSRPQLSWVGEKLKPEWASQFIAGKIAYKPRPYIQARMPGFPARATLLAEGLAHQHGYPAVTPPDAKPDPALVPVGQQLAGKANGFSCNACHAIADAPALAAFEAPASNFAHAAERLRHDYYTRWVRNPQRVERGTRMPTFATTDGKTPVRDVLDGDADKQFEALWHYLLQGPKIQPPTQ
jgi:mono/diheme cytochrome c family protein